MYCSITTTTRLCNVFVEVPQKKMSYVVSNIVVTFKQIMFNTFIIKSMYKILLRLTFLPVHCYKQSVIIFGNNINTTRVTRERSVSVVYRYSNSIFSCQTHNQLEQVMQCSLFHVLKIKETVAMCQNMLLLHENGTTNCFLLPWVNVVRLYN